MTWDALQKEILEKMRHLLRPGVYIQVGGRTSSWPFILNVQRIILMQHIVGFSVYFPDSTMFVSQMY